MFQYSQNNVLCIEGRALYENGIMTEGNYYKIKQRYLESERRGGNGRTSLIVYSSIPERFKLKIEELFGNPYKTTKHSQFRNYLKQDIKAIEFYNDYTLDSGEALPEKKKKEYTANASVLNAIHTITSKNSARRRALGGSKTKMWDKIASIIQDLPKHTYPHSLPKNHRDIKAKCLAFKNIKLCKRYPTPGYEGLIHNGFCNKNSEKINDNAKLWILSRWANQVQRCATVAQLFREYNLRAEIEGWKELKDQTTIYNYLQQTESMWYAHRRGELKAKAKFDYQHSTKMPSMRDSLWYSDGTKMNLYYLDENGKMATCQVYEVMDAFSEVFLGYHISKTENYEAQYYAYKMAAQTAEHRPYEIKFDGQGGHGLLTAGNFLKKMARIAVKTKPYNGSSKTIESAFGRFQQQIMAKAWNFTGQNIGSKKAESKSNMELILANPHKLPTLQEVKQQYAEMRQEWNESIHFKSGKPRLEMYLSSSNPETPELSIWDMVDMFWITREKPVTVTPYKIGYREKKAKYNYMVHTADGLPDFKWLGKWIDKEVYIKYSPDDRSLVYLYEKTPLGLRFITGATTKVEVQRNTQEQEEFERSWMTKVELGIKQNRVDRYYEMEKILEDHGASAAQQGFNTPKISGVKSTYQKKGAKQTSIGAHQKEESNMDAVEVAIETGSIYDKY